uniref:Importin-7/11-like TPR repeats domain-containing protein n=1 Tax=Pavo cristatus TaxID=9049 RepID=A0A8C9FW19_PAVCR
MSSSSVNKAALKLFCHTKGCDLAAHWVHGLRLLALKDPVHTVSLQQFVYEKLKAQQELLGEQGFHALMETVDTEVVAQLQEFLQGF